MRLVSFDYFRGIAIIFIVAGHSLGPWLIDSFSEKVLVNLISGGTILFVFISGYFFHYIFYNKFNFKKFLVKKYQNVLLPYTILTISGIGYYSLSSAQFPWADTLELHNVESVSEYIRIIAIYLWTGCIASTYWYIPFISIIFIMSPVFLRYIRLPTIYRISIFLILLIASVFIHRPTGNLFPLHSALYFIPIYMLGIMSSIHREQVSIFIEGKSLAIGCVVLILAILQVFFLNGSGNFHKDEIFSYNGMDIIIIQKIVMCFFLLSLLQKHESRHIPGLKILAASSFAIYFIHPWVFILFQETGVFSFFKFLPDFGMFLLTVPLVLASSLFIAYLVKLALKNNSRYIIGW